MRRLVLFWLLFVLPFAAFARGGHGGHHSGGTVHVHGYYRHDGTYVHGYDRSAPGQGTGRSGHAEGTKRSENLKTCLAGNLSVLCDHSLLTPEELKQAQEAERRDNLKTCLAGNLSVLCNHSLLTPTELEQVQAAEHRDNFKTCASGKLPVLCNHSLLTAEELEQVRSAERRENLKTCLSGRFSVLCDHSKLTPEEFAQVRTIEDRAASSPGNQSTREPKALTLYPRTGRGYVNSQGERVPSPTWTENGKPPAGASARCRDGSYSFSRSRRGTCSHHGGVSQWL